MIELLRRPFPYTYKSLTLVLIAANVLVFFFSQVFEPELLLNLAMNPYRVLEGRWWELITYMFSHGSSSHLFYNMLGLFFFGFSVEQRVGSWEFLSMYFITGFLAGLFSFLVYVAGSQYHVYLLGSSGAVYAVLLFFAAYFPDQRIYFMYFLPLRATTLVLLYTALELFNSLFFQHSGVAHLTHLAGFFFAGLYLAVRLNRNILSILMGRRHHDDYF